MTAKTSGISVSSVVVEGLAPEQALQAEMELYTLLRPFEGMSLDLLGDVTLSVIMTDRMEEHVNRIAKEYGSLAGTHSREKAFGISVGIPLTAPGGPPFRTCLVLHNGMWAQADGLAVIDRTFLLGYIFGLALRRWQGTVTDWIARGKECQTIAQELRDGATALMEAFDADRIALLFCKNLHLSDGNAVRCSDFLGEGFILDVKNVADQLGVFAAIDIGFYRVTAVGLEELYPRVAPILSNAMQMLVHIIALYTEDGGLAAAKEALSASGGFRTYLQPDVDAIAVALTDDDRNAGEAQLVETINRILLRLGLRIEDMPDGSLYVHVSQPLLSPILADSPSGGELAQK